MYYSKKQREYYNEQRAVTCERLGITNNQYNWFRRIGTELHKLYEQNCNGELTEGQYEAYTDVFYDKANQKAKELGLHIFYQTDPRGATIYLDRVEIPENNYTRAFCIY